MQKRKATKHVFPNDKATNEWLDTQKKGTRNVYATHWKWFLQWTGMTGDQILQSRKNDKDAAWEKKLLPYREWLKGRGFSDLYSRQSTISVRSFFAFHRVELKMTHQESGKLMQARRKTEDYRFSSDDLKRMADVANLDEQYILVVGKSFGLRAGDFANITRGHFDALNLDSPTPIFFGEYATQKEGVNAFPFLDSDAVQVVKAKLAEMVRRGLTNPDVLITNYKNDIELTRIIKKLADRAGISIGNKHVRFHCLRKYLIDVLSRFMSESKWKQIVGKKITEGAYVSPDSLREDFARAMPEIIFTKALTQDVELLAQKKALEAIAKMMNIPEAQRKTIFRSVAAAKTVKELNDIEAQMKQSSSWSGGMSFEDQAARTLESIFEKVLKRMEEKR